MPNGRTWPRISIVTPSYNQGQFLEETIRSVLGQGYPNLEYIVIDGGSSDSSVEIIGQYEKWSAHWVSEKDRGQSEAINNGFRRASGEICAWLNSDDMYQANALGQVAQFLSQHPNVDLVYGSCQVVDDCGGAASLLDPPEFQLSRLLHGSYIPQQATFFRRHVLDKVGLLNEELHYAMDYDLWLRIASRFSVAHVSKVWASYRVSEGSKSVSMPEAFWPEILMTLEKFFARPELDASIRTEKSTALGLAHLQAGFQNFRMGKVESGKRHLDSALQVDPALKGQPETILRLLVSYGRGLDRPAAENYVAGVFENLSPSMAGLRNKKNIAATRVAFLNVFHYAPERGRQWILTHIPALLSDVVWFMQGTVLGMLLFMLLSKAPDRDARPR